ncbi:hypothetical protein BDD12DRAFT_808977 [Trichophaea hybrida]|nr:hypothetical protein BDD12DRAFT_808977 [Trichophaea hybrida]
MGEAFYWPGTQSYCEASLTSTSSSIPSDRWGVAGVYLPILATIGLHLFSLWVNIRALTHHSITPVPNIATLAMVHTLPIRISPDYARMLSSSNSSDISNSSSSIPSPPTSPPENQFCNNTYFPTMGSNDESSSDDSSSSSSVSPEPLQTISNRGLPPPQPAKRVGKADNCPPAPRKRPALLSQQRPEPIQDDDPKVFWEHPGYYPYTKEQVVNDIRLKNRGNYFPISFFVTFSDATITCPKNESADSDWSDGEPRPPRPNEKVKVVKRLQKQAIMLQKKVTKISEERKKRDKSRQRRKWYLNKKRRDAEKREMETKTKDMEAKGKESIIVEEQEEGDADDEDDDEEVEAQGQETPEFMRELREQTRKYAEASLEETSGDESESESEED